MSGVPSCEELARARRAGWPARLPTPPPWLLRADRITRWRRHRLDRLRGRHPRLHAMLQRGERWQTALLDTVMPVERIGTTASIAAALTLFDALATALAVVVLEVPEANPLVASWMTGLGVTGALVARSLLGVALLVAMAWVAPWRVEARAGLGVAAAALVAVAGWHVTGILRVLAL